MAAIDGAIMEVNGLTEGNLLSGVDQWLEFRQRASMPFGSERAFVLLRIVAGEVFRQNAR